MARPVAPTPLLQGTLDVLILKALSLQPLHGLGVADRIAQITTGAFVVQPGSLFPALHRMEEKGWLDSSCGTSEKNRKAKFYKLTAAGRKQLAVEAAEWTRGAAAMAAALPASGTRSPASSNCAPAQP